MAKHRKPGRDTEATLPQQPAPGVLVELEGIAMTADMCISSLPVVPTGKYKRTLRRLYVLVGATAGRASEERSEDMLAQLAATPRQR